MIGIRDKPLNNKAFVIAALLLAACGKPSDTAAQVDVPTSYASRERWPEGVPEFARAYPGGTVTTSYSGTSDTTKHGGMVVFTTADAPERVVSFYRDEVKRAGLGEVATMGSGGAQMFSASDKAGKRSLSVQAGPDGGATSVTLSYEVAG